jgi:hypothetical protein
MKKVIKNSGKELTKMQGQNEIFPQITTLDSIRTAYLTQSLLDLRQHLESTDPLHQLSIPADELFYQLLVAIDLPIESINLILGTDYPNSS